MTIIEKKRTIVESLISLCSNRYACSFKRENKPLSNLPDMFTSLIPLYSSLTKVVSQVYARILRKRVLVDIATGHQNVDN